MRRVMQALRPKKPAGATFSVRGYRTCGRRRALGRSPVRKISAGTQRPGRMTVLPRDRRGQILRMQSVITDDEHGSTAASHMDRQISHLLHGLTNLLQFRHEIKGWWSKIVEESIKCWSIRPRQLSNGGRSALIQRSLLRQIIIGPECIEVSIDLGGWTLHILWHEGDDIDRLSRRGSRLDYLPKAVGCRTGNACKEEMDVASKMSSQILQLIDRQAKIKQAIASEQHGRGVT